MAKYTYKKLLSEKNFLRVAERARRLNGCQLVAILYKDNMLIFKTLSGTDHKTIWTQRVVIDDLSPRKLRKLKFNQTEHVIKWSGLHCACDCYAFRYWGFAYWSYKRGYGLVKETRVPRVRNPYGQGYVCFTGETKVLTNLGWKEIRNINPGDLVYTGKGRLRKVKSVFEYNSDEVLSLRIGRNTWISCTKNHPFLVNHYLGYSISSTSRFKPEKVKWDQAENIKEGDFLIRPYLRNEENTEVSVINAFMLGLYLADGTLSYRSAAEESKASITDGVVNVKGLSIAFCAEKRQVYEELLTKFGLRYKIRITEDNGGDIFIYDENIRKFCFEHGGYTSEKFKKSKRLGSEVLEWNKDAKIALLEGFFMGDGTLVKGAGTRRNGYKTYMTFFNTNKEIMEILNLLLNEKFIVNLRSYKRKPFKSSAKLGTVHMIYPKQMYWIRLTGEQAKELIRCFKFGVQAKHQCSIADAVTSYKLKDYEIEGHKVQPVIVKEIKEKKGSYKVYNLEVEEDETYLVEGVVVHNCKHLHQVMQVLPFLSKTLAKKFRDNLKPENDAQLESNMSDEELDKKGMKELEDFEK